MPTPEWMGGPPPKAPERPIEFTVHFQKWKRSVSFKIMESNGYSHVEGHIYNHIPKVYYHRFLSVTPEEQGKGFGSATLKKAESIAIDNNCHTIVLVAEKGKWVIDWYKRIGYVEYADKDENHISMYKYLKK